MPRRALEITADICAALEFSHRHGIIHRDIKPGNVMLTQNGQVKVMDFGIARALASGATTMTQTSAVIGTAQYLSPEQARGEAVDARSDVYAAGCVLFELLCGHPPFVGDSPVSVAYQHVREDPQAPSDINRDVTAGRRRDRAQGAGEEPAQPLPERRRDARRPAARRRRPAGAGHAGDARGRDHADGAAATVAAAAPGSDPAVPARVGDPRRRRTSGWVIAALAALGVLAVIALVAGLIAAPASREARSRCRRWSARPSRGGAAAARTAGSAGPEQPATRLRRLHAGPGRRARTRRRTAEVDGELARSPYQVCGGPEHGDRARGRRRLQGGPRPRTALESLELAESVEEIDSEEPEGRSSRSTRRPAQQVAEGTKVTLSSPRATSREVPNVVGSVAGRRPERLLERGRLQGRRRGRPTDGRPDDAGKVIEPEPGGRQQLKVGERGHDRGRPCRRARPARPRQPAPTHAAPPRRPRHRLAACSATSPPRAGSTSAACASAADASCGRRLASGGEGGAAAGLDLGGEGAGPVASASGSPHVASQLASMMWPPWVSTDSGWNCTPSIGSVRWRIAITTPDSVGRSPRSRRAASSRQHGQRVVAGRGERVRQPGQHARAACGAPARSCRAAAPAPGSTVPPYAAPIAWCPRQTPKIGSSPRVLADHVQADAGPVRRTRAG